ncbi:hypothetical protein [Limosilactobacillus fermentum]|uniref:hypothetical protein n=1 Tax=Limosilactobacillus fermentum TaxID=1613 RepID=UPI0021A5AE45|nr:hypothetical protein [Limosilactobacillus fermentum]
MRSVAEPVTSTFDPNGGVKPTNDQTVQQIKAYLDARHIGYQSSANKSDLLKLVG